MADPWAPATPIAEVAAEDEGAVQRRMLVEAAVAHRWSDVGRQLQSMRGTLAEGEALEALGAFADDLPDAVRIPLAQIWVARGELARAIELLGHVEQPSGLVMLADLLREGPPGGAPTRADLERAHALYGRALRVDWEAPGVHERWERLGIQLGLHQASPQPALGSTLVASGPAVHFTLVREVARGGSGTVFEAREQIGPLTRQVALKVAHDPRLGREQLMHEARVAVSLRGRGIVRVHDVDPTAAWLALEWVGGGSLAKPQVPFDAASVVATLRAGLARIHALGWVHGDVKPSNVLLDLEGRPVLADFGLARRIGAPNTPGTAGFRSEPRIAGAPCAPIDDLFALERIESMLGLRPTVPRAAPGS